MSGSLAIGLAAFAFLLYRQVQRRPIGGRGRGTVRRGEIALVLLAVGAIELASFAQHRHFGAASVAILCASFAVGGALGVARGFAVRLWSENGRLYRQGTAITVVLWLVGVGLPLAGERLIERAGGPAGAGQATLLLYLALAVTVQTLVLRRRVRALLGPGRRDLSLAD